MGTQQIVLDEIEMLLDGEWVASSATTDSVAERYEIKNEAGGGSGTGTYC
jgi:hypothetical protein